MADWTFERDYQFAPKSRQRVRVTATVSTPGAREFPDNYQFRGGQYYEVFVEAGDLHVRRSDHATPPFAWETTVVDGGAISYPQVYMLPRGHVVILYQKGAGGVYYAVSYDEARTFGTPALTIANGTKPRGTSNPFDASEIVAAFIVASGKISAVSREAGELNFGAAFFFKDSAGVDLLFEDDTFGLYWGYVTHNPLMGLFHIDGETDVSTWRSYDLGRSWTREP